MTVDEEMRSITDAAGAIIHDSGIGSGVRLANSIFAEWLVIVQSNPALLCTTFIGKGWRRYVRVGVTGHCADEPACGDDIVGERRQDARTHRRTGRIVVLPLGDVAMGPKSWAHVQ